MNYTISSPRSPSPDIDVMVEGYNQTVFGYGIMSKAHSLYKAGKLVGYDLLRLSNTCIPTGYLQMEALIQPFMQPSSPSSEEASTLLSYTMREWRVISNHPFCHAMRQFCFIKQTCDFSLAFFEWIQGSRSHSSMARNTVNTALSYIPLFINYFGEEFSSSTLFMNNAILMGCLAYSMHLDYLSSQDPQFRESSPTVAKIKKLLF